jgi:hypothetical protein
MREKLGFSFLWVDTFPKNECILGIICRLGVPDIWVDIHRLWSRITDLAWFPSEGVVFPLVVCAGHVLRLESQPSTPCVEFMDSLGL